MDKAKIILERCLGKNREIIDYPKDVWNKAMNMTVEDSNKFFEEYDRKHKIGFYAKKYKKNW